MEIHLVSSLTPDDERRLAPAMLAAIGRILDSLPVSYSVRLETSTGSSIQHSRTAAAPSGYNPGTYAGGSDPLAGLAPPGGPFGILDRD